MDNYGQNRDTNFHSEKNPYINNGYEPQNTEYDYENQDTVYRYDEDQYMDYTQRFDVNTSKPYPPQKKTNTGLIVALTVLASLLAVLFIVAILFLTGVLNFGDKDDSSKRNKPTATETATPKPTDEKPVKKPTPVNKTMYINCDVSVTLRSAPTTEGTEIRQISNGTTVFVIEFTNSTFAKVSHKGQEGYVMSSYLSDTPSTIPVEKNMYVDCNVSITLRTGPATSYSEIHSIPVGESVYVIEYTNNEFAKVNHNGSVGYVMSKYLSDEQPYVWEYDSYDVENFIEEAAYAFVDGINYDDTDFVYDYYTGSIVNQQIKECESISGRVVSEEILQSSCHSVQRVSPVQVTVIRDSTTRVEYNDGETKDLTERYQYTVDYSKGRMYIVAVKAV